MMYHPAHFIKNNSSKGRRQEFTGHCNCGNDSNGDTVKVVGHFRWNSCIDPREETSGHSLSVEDELQGNQEHPAAGIHDRQVT